MTGEPQTGEDGPFNREVRDVDRFNVRLSNTIFTVIKFDT